MRIDSLPLVTSISAAEKLCVIRPANVVFFPIEGKWTFRCVGQHFPRDAMFCAIGAFVTWACRPVAVYINPQSTDVYGKSLIEHWAGTKKVFEPWEEGELFEDHRLIEKADGNIWFARPKVEIA